ncbi:hypothetical protein CPB86DRAFT_787394 [Serendipita vermifera]|nr:hypothetical protein CPB86DRAFT_787394 [Serendipita vermifera]
MAEFNPVDPQNGWEYDLHSIYKGYIRHFQSCGIDWWNKSWGTFFATFDQFLQFGWQVIVITDVYEPHRAHIVTNMKNLQAFLRMIRAQSGEILKVIDDIVQIRPFENRSRLMKYIAGSTSYKELHSTLPAAFLTSQKERIRDGDPQSISKIWNSRDLNFVAIDFEWSERDSSVPLEFGYAILDPRLTKPGQWPPNPEKDYRLGHYVIEENVDKFVNKRFPTYPRSFKFGTTSYVSKNQLMSIIQTLFDSLSSPESDNQANEMVLVAHGASGDLERLSELKINIPGNVLVLDTTTFERQLLRIGRRRTSMDSILSAPRQAGSMLSLANLVASLGVDISRFVFHNSGNDAYATLLALQLLLEPDTPLEDLKLERNPDSTDTSLQSHPISPLSLSEQPSAGPDSKTNVSTKNSNSKEDPRTEEPFNRRPQRGSRGGSRGATYRQGSNRRGQVRGRNAGRPPFPRGQPPRDRKLEDDLRDLTI